MNNETKTKSRSKKQASEAAPATSLLESVGLEALERHGYDSVFVTTDGTVFRQECDALNHSSNLESKEIIKVTRK